MRRRDRYSSFPIFSPHRLRKRQEQQDKYNKERYQYGDSEDESEGEIRMKELRKNPSPVSPPERMKYQERSKLTPEQLERVNKQKEELQNKLNNKPLTSMTVHDIIKIYSSSIEEEYIKTTQYKEKFVNTITKGVENTVDKLVAEAQPLYGKMLSALNPADSAMADIRADIRNLFLQALINSYGKYNIPQEIGTIFRELRDSTEVSHVLHKLQDKAKASEYGEGKDFYDTYRSMYKDIIVATVPGFCKEITTLLDPNAENPSQDSLVPEDYNSVLQEFLEKNPRTPGVGDLIYNMSIGVLSHDARESIKRRYPTWSGQHLRQLSVDLKKESPRWNHYLEDRAEYG